MTPLIGSGFPGASFFGTFSDLLLPRLLTVSLEVIVLAALVWALTRFFRVKSPRLKAFLWLLVLAKPLVGLAIGRFV